mmetsp:Transcript_50241/g.130460  ORF Transcript_50241/g.130460 Transcript_50241/m.130460 type:complete len:317 (-) Transcript_50241:521-1471(-)
MISLYTRTSRVWPILKARSTAWASVAGFQDGSTSTTRSALVRFRPTPPTLVVKSMHWNRSGCLLNFCTFSARATASVWPSMRRHRRPCGFRQHTWMRSSIFRLCEKISVRCPRTASAGSNSLRQRSLALCCIIERESRGSLFSITSVAWPARASSFSAAAPETPGAARLSASPAQGVRSRPSVSGPSGFCTCCGSCDAIASDRMAAQAPGFGVGTRVIGWLQSRLRRPIARNTSIPSFCLEQASRITSLFSRIFLYAWTCSPLGASQITVSFLGINFFTSSPPSASSTPDSAPQSGAPASSPSPTRPVPSLVRRSR